MLTALLLVAASLDCGGGGGGGNTPVPVAPTISAQPTSQTTPEGATATFSVVASGTDPLTYQWKKGGVALTTGGTSASYTTPAVALADNGSSYTVTISNVAGSITSGAATLTVDPTQPTITTSRIVAMSFCEPRS